MIEGLPKISDNVHSNNGNGSARIFRLPDLSPKSNFYQGLRDIQTKLEYLEADTTEVYEYPVPNYEKVYYPPPDNNQPWPNVALGDLLKPIRTEPFLGLKYIDGGYVRYGWRPNDNLGWPEVDIPRNLRVSFAYEKLDRALSQRMAKLGKMVRGFYTPKYAGTRSKEAEA